MHLRLLLKRLLSPFLQFLARRYARVSHFYRNKGIKMEIYPSVFHPGLYISTAIFADFLAKKDLQKKTVWELGAGSGFLALFCAKQGAIVTATDINLTALEGLQKNAQHNHLHIEILYSDLFAEIGFCAFDYILINPPYYPRTPKNDMERAFFCGEDFGYFLRLFAGLRAYFTHFPAAGVYMILSEDCDIVRISVFLEKEKLQWECIKKKRKWGEWNFIFRIFATQ